jgi:hypothetical protein
MTDGTWITESNWMQIGKIFFYLICIYFLMCICPNFGPTDLIMSDFAYFSAVTVFQPNSTVNYGFTG